jgi:nesprin-1
MKLCSILDHTVYCKLNNIKKKNHKIFFQRLQSEVGVIEDLFKTVSKKFQAMIQDLSRDEVDRIMNTLKKEKGEQPCN